MPVLEAEQDPKEAGFDATRLERTSRHVQSYVDDGRLPGWSIALARAGRVVYTAVSVVRDVEAGLPVERDTLWRIYSMTKPVTSRIRCPDSCRSGRTSGCSARGPRSSSSPRRQRSRSACGICSHTLQGLTYGFHYAHPVDALYRAQGFEWTTPDGVAAPRLEHAPESGPGRARGCAQPELSERLASVRVTASTTGGIRCPDGALSAC
jgi:hypothetical protein